ncbi:VOC family protein [Micromonospora sp. NBC_01796]|uniref:VOC family protein n=1 Tax=Micromonospora sp. NBC_01796 TaxID=2975987 RepID=UPI002DDA87AE|nr:VOC family protein [Micromonospora sp. NBC_01796]WSA86942.1 VOC family protein [Micromonospora sp. NBC_01796]
MAVAFRDPFPIILSDDPARLTAFYRERLGFTESYRFPPEQDSEPEFVVLTLGGAQFAFGRADDTGLHGIPRGADNGRRTEVCLYTDDVDRAVEDLRTVGVPVLFEPADQPWRERAAYVADPDGNPILIVAPLTTQATPPATEPTEPIAPTAPTAPTAPGNRIASAEPVAGS